MKNSSGRKSGHKETLPWDKAVLVAGSSERLTRGVNEHTARGWRKGVPAYVVIRLIKENLRLQGMAPSADDPPALLETLERVRKYWGTKRWEKLDLALELVGEPYRSTDQGLQR